MKTIAFPKKVRKISFFFLLMVFFLQGCVKGNLVNRKIPVPEMAISEAIEKTRNNQDFVYKDFESECWWHIFHDPSLSFYIETSLVQNPSLPIAFAKIQKANDLADQAKSFLSPSINWRFQYDHFKISDTEISPLGVVGPLSYNNYQNLLDFCYHFDLWGKYRQEWQARLGEREALQRDFIVTKLMLSISVANYYYSLQSTLKKIEIAKALVKNREKNYEFFQKRIDYNLSDLLALEEAVSDLGNAIDMLYSLEQEKSFFQNALYALIGGNFQEEIKKIDVTDAALTKVPIPTCLPLDLLARRPDIVAQKWRIYSAYKEIGVAKAAFYPNLDIFSLVGFRTIFASDLFKGGSYSGDYGGAIHLPLFDGGRRRAYLRAKEQETIIQIEEYNQMVLQAAKEVITGLELLFFAKKRWQEEDKILHAVDKRYFLFQERVKNNIDSLMQSLFYEKIDLEQQMQVANAKEQMLLSILSLIKALGGGYDWRYE